MDAKGMATSSNYELQMGRWSRRLAPLFVAFSGIREGERVLDVGCGTGSLTFALAQNALVKEIHAVDKSPCYIQHAKNRSDDPRIKFQVADALTMPFESAYFDHTVSLLVLAFISDAHRAVREMRRVTRPGGTLAASMWDVRGGVVPFRIFWDTAAILDAKAAARRARGCVRPMTRPGDLARAWHAAGLKNVVDDALTIRMEFASFEDFWTPFAEYVNTLPDEHRGKLREAIHSAYIDGEPEGPRSYAASAWVVKGTVP